MMKTSKGDGMLFSGQPGESRRSARQEWRSSRGGPGRRGGTSLTEVVVAGVLLTSTIGLVGTGVLAVRRLVHQGQQSRIAARELSNQLELLTMTQPPELDRIGEDLRLTASINDHLPGAQMQAELIDDALGKRVLLSLDWDRIGNPPPMRMVGWIRSADSSPSSNVEGESQ